MKLNRLIGAAALALAAANPAGAAVVTTTATFDPDSGNHFTSLTLGGFDTTLGTLTSVTFGYVDVEAPWSMTYRDIAQPYGLPQIHFGQIFRQVSNGSSLAAIAGHALTATYDFYGTLPPGTPLGPVTFTSPGGPFGASYTTAAPGDLSQFTVPSFTVGLHLLVSDAADRAKYLVTLDGGSGGGIAGTYTVAYTYTPTVVTPAVPEPAAWALMLAGFGLTGAAVRRRRGAAVAA